MVMVTMVLVTVMLVRVKGGAWQFTCPVVHPRLEFSPALITAEPGSVWKLGRTEAFELERGSLSPAPAALCFSLS